MDYSRRCLIDYWLLLVLIAGLLTRLYPVLYSGMPFSTDSWPLIRTASVVATHTPVSLSDNKLFDRYNNYWPLLPLTTLIISSTTGEPLVTIAKYLVPVLNGLSIAIVYSIIKRFSSRLNSLLASLSIALIPSLTVFGAGVTKEGFTWFLVYTLVLLVIVFNKRVSLPLTILSVAIVFSHHVLTYFLVITSTLYLLLHHSRRDSRYYGLVVVVATLVLTSMVHYLFFARESIFYKKLWLVVENRLSYILPLVAVAILAIVLLVNPRVQSMFSKRSRTTIILVSTLLAIVFLTAITKLLTSSNYIAIALTTDLLYYMVPPIVLVVLEASLKTLDSFIYRLSTVWIVSSILLTALLVYSGLLLSSIHRFLNILIIGFILLAPTIEPKGFRRYLLVIYTLSLLVTPYTMYRIVAQEDNIAYYWFYSYSEVSSIDHIVSRLYLGNKTLLAGDSKYSFLLTYYGLESTSSPIYQFRRWCRILYGEFLFITSPQHITKGFPLLSGRVYIEDVDYCLDSYSLVYNSGYVYVYYLKH